MTAFDSLTVAQLRALERVISAVTGAPEPSPHQRPPERWVLVTTSHRDVWYGRTDADHTDASLVLSDARHCYYFDTSEGIGQLTRRGPGARAKIGAIVGRLSIRDVVGVLDCTPEAVEAFAAAGWAR